MRHWTEVMSHWSLMVQFIKRRGRKLLCPHRYQLWVRNIYGDGILHSGGKRSVWKCQSCDRFLVHPFLFKSTSKPK